MRLALAQINTKVGDIAGNTRLILESVDSARRGGADVVVFPELAVFGYPPKDLVRRRALIEANLHALQRIAAASTGIATVVGYVQPEPGEGTEVRNAAACCRDGRILATYAKRLLPTYDVFDEARYFTPGKQPAVVDVPLQRGGTIRLGLTVCEDLWNDSQFEGRRVYGLDPVADTVDAGAQVIINVSASPFVVGKPAYREKLFGAQIRARGVPLVMVNQVGGNDDLIFDGTSSVLDPQGNVLARARSFVEEMIFVDLPNGAAPIAEIPDSLETIRLALRCGIRDYLHKCGFREGVIGLSGGIDSAVTAALAVEALGAENVHGVLMPSRFSSSHSVTDAELLAANLGIHSLTVAIGPVHDAMEESLAPVFKNHPPDVTEENIQSRIRGNLLMALSNKFHWLVLSTGNKSEIAVGYCTMYGDMSGGLAVLSDVPKTTVYALARRINESAGRELIPQNTIDKPPSAELKEDQKDADSLPAYDVLDPILERYIEQDESVDTIVAAGFDRDIVKRVVTLVDTNEYKRQQIPVGIKVTSRAFGTGRRMPIAARHRADID